MASVRQSLSLSATLSLPKQNVTRVNTKESGKCSLHFAKLERISKFQQRSKKTSVTFWLKSGSKTFVASVTAMVDGNGHAKAGVGEVAIVGGGLGGLAAAIALRSQGINVQVYERNRSIAGGEGTMLTLFPNGIHALALADPSIVSKLKDSGVPNPVSETYTPDGKFLFGWGNSSSMEESYGYPAISIRWRELLDIFSCSLPSECIHTGHELLSVEQEGERVVAKFKTEGGGEKLVETPLLVGADGIRSKVRESMTGSPSPSLIRDNERTIWRAVIPFDTVSHPLVKPGKILVSLADGKSAMVADAGKNCLYWAYTVTDGMRGEDKNVRSKNGEEAKEKLQKYYEGWEMFLHVLEATNPDSIIERRVLDLPVLDKWVYDRVVLLGDAAHAVVPVLGQGANLAFEDGWELAQLLQSHDSVKDALTEYEEVRIPRARNVASQSLKTAKGTYSKQKPSPPPPQSQEQSKFYEYMYSFKSGSTARA